MTAIIPKPGKPPHIDNLRPISLTSCIAKVAEHAIHNRIVAHIESRELFRHNLVGFRQSLSTQDAMLLLKRAIFDNKTRDVRGILALDLAKAFDRVKHRHILREISALNLGRNFHDFTKSFLANRKAHIRLGTVSGGPYELGNRGTPQGSFLSSLLFNIAMHRLSARLAEIQNVGHVIYADDISIWVPGGSMATIEHSLQNALETIEGFLSDTGLDLSPSKSEHLLYRQSKQGVRNLEPLESLPIVIKAKNGQPIPRVDSVKIIGLLIDAKGCNATALNKLSGQAGNVI